LVEQLENCDKSKFELFAFCLKSVEDPMQQRLKASFDHWIEVGQSADVDIAKLSRQLEIDIALDLNGHTSDGRPGIFAARAAPIQMSQLGFPGTMGAEYIDYYLADEFLVPEQTRQYFTEKIVYAPCAYTYDRQRQPSVEPLTRSQFGLPDGAFVFTCQNGCQKITPDVFDVWMDLLRAVPNSVLWLLEPHPTAVQNLRKEAQARGVQSERLIFTKRETVPKDQEMARIGRYLASYKLADLFLDTWPYNAGTTGIDALWAGLPVVTKSGESVVARMTTSALHAIEMPELITTPPQEYRDLAVGLATNPQKLKQIKEKIDKNRLTTALFDPVTNTRYIEAAYLELYRLYQENHESKMIRIYK
jgi:predicted O-linked N-acetylglucosamine transferase (SPINDLY family)